ncbi:exosome subunit Rrp46 [Schizosaccharomyces cryophilus OY26]|uniref:Exosome subunit Rrp46 n=1 Tax=Schizosaccharomyces cryophilus (strain OY26 / ATCC MYA-4695 / CBS 11777 / NBRC 106824 / NRRL Y48691) TaxID=653667 RepID=S9VWE7_SCHCR|nr:exosome subunit Rrp46 [Schizosaccharomyces cryophilus OY26]EPY50569.1 exosome subunit Rrp46 [Schizosaccharomyces cryophilus OY26]
MNKIGFLTQSDGSSEWKQGSTRVICNVNGPIEIKIRDEKLNKASVEVLVQPMNGASETLERMLSNRISSLLEDAIYLTTYPRTLIQVSIQVVEGNSQDTLAAAINGATLALLDAGISLKYLPSAITCHWKDPLGFSEFKNVTAEEPTEMMSSIINLAYSVSMQEKKLILVETSGTIPDEEFFLVLSKSPAHVDKITQEMKTLFMNAYNKDLPIGEKKEEEEEDVKMKD